MTWEKGRESIELLLRQGHLEQVIANPDEARHLVGRARTHLSTAAETAEADPEIAYDAHADIPAATAIVDLAERLLATGKLTVFAPIA